MKCEQTTTNQHTTLGRIHSRDAVCNRQTSQFHELVQTECAFLRMHQFIVDCFCSFRIQKSPWESQILNSEFGSWSTASPFKANTIPLSVLSLEAAMRILLFLSGLRLCSEQHRSHVRRHFVPSKDIRIHEGNHNVLVGL